MSSPDDPRLGRGVTRAVAMVAPCALGLFCLGGDPAAGQCLEEKLLLAGGSIDDLFGVAVAVDGDVAIVGACRREFAGTAPGTAEIYRFDGAAWVHEQTLGPSDPMTEQNFGVSADISGDRAVVGSYHEPVPDDVRYRVNLFGRLGSVWVRQGMFEIADLAMTPFLNQACKVAIDGDVAVAGIAADDDLGPSAGAVYVYRHDGSAWLEEAKLLASDGQHYDQFGFSVDVDENVIVAGASNQDNVGPGAGAAYVFRHVDSTWVEEAKLLASDGSAWAFLGFSASVKGNLVLIGATMADGNAINSGAVYVFHFDGSAWSEETKLIAPDGEENDGFGAALAVHGDVAVVGAGWDDDNGEDSGSVYVYRRGGGPWAEADKILAPDGEDGDYFGACAIAIHDDHAWIGCAWDDDLAHNSGSVYLLDAAGEDCNATYYCDWLDILNGTSPDLNGNGIPDECECPADVNGDGAVNVLDLLAVLAAWGATSGPEDINADGVVNVLDLLEVLAAWGPCE